MLRKACLVVLGVALAADGYAVPDASAQEWARGMFETFSHDFGSLPKGAKAEYSFVVTNNFAADVHIAAVRTSCGCTTPRIEKPFLKTYEKGAIIAHLNSDSYIGRRAATLTVTIDQPAYAEVQLQIRAMVHDDVLMEPTAVQFGTVDQGAPAEAKIRLYRADMYNWQITGVKMSNPNLTGQVVEVARQGSQVWYDLHVRLDKNTPAGYIMDHAVLTTSDPSASQIPVMVEGQVQSQVVLSPSSLFLGLMKPGDKVTKPLVVRANKPFRIKSITADKGAFELPKPPEEAKALHLVPVTFVAGSEWGKVVKTIHIETDLPGGSVEAASYAVVGPGQ